MAFSLSTDASLSLSSLFSSISDSVSSTPRLKKERTNASRSFARSTGRSLVRATRSSFSLDPSLMTKAPLHGFSQRYQGAAPMSIVETIVVDFCSPAGAAARRARPVRTLHAGYESKRKQRAFEEGCEILFRSTLQEERRTSAAFRKPRIGAPAGCALD